MELNTILFYLCTAITLLAFLLSVIFSAKHVIDKQLLKSKKPFRFVGLSLILVGVIGVTYTQVYTEEALINPTLNLWLSKALWCLLIGWIIYPLVIIKNRKLIPKNLYSPALFILIVLIGINLWLPVVWIKEFSVHGLITSWLVLLNVITFLSFSIWLGIGHRNYLSFAILSIPTLLMMGIYSHGFTPLNAFRILLINLTVLDFLTSMTHQQSFLRLNRVLHFLRTKMFFKLILVFTLLVIIALSVTTLSILTITKNALIETQSKGFFQISTSMKDEGTQFTNRATAMLNDIKKHRSIRDKNEFVRSAYLYDVVRNNRSLDQLVLFNPQGAVIALADINTLGGALPEKAPAFVQEALLLNRQFKPYTAYEKGHIIISIPVFDFSGTYLFSLAGLFNFSTLNTLYHQIQQTTGLTVEIIDNNYYSLLNKTTLPEDHPIRNLDVNSTKLQSYVLNDETYIVTTVYDPQLTLTYMTLELEKVALSGVLEGERRALIILFGSTLFFLVIGLAVSVMIEKPVKVIQRGLEQYRQGKFDHQISINNVDEFGELAQALNDMSTDLKNMFELKAKSEQLATISQMAVSLNHEINSPLATITMATGVLSTSITDEMLPGGSTLIETIDKQAQRIAELVGNVAKITEPVVEDYVNGTKMIKINFDKTY